MCRLSKKVIVPFSWNNILLNDKRRQMTAKDIVFSVERLFYDLMKSGHPALDPLVITADGLLSIKEEVLKSPQQLCTILHGHR